MPAIRQPLRERCKVQLQVITAISTEASLDTPVQTDEPFSAVRRGRQRHVVDVRVPYTNPVKKAAPTSVPRLNPLNPHGLWSLWKLIPYIYLALHTGTKLPRSLVTDDGTAFTHIVKITHATSDKAAGTVELKADPKRGFHSLILVVPPAAPRTRGRRRVRSGGERNTTVLSENQLLAARDFLSLALPYYSEAHPREDIPVTSADRVRLLLTAPTGDGAASDVVSIAVCYLAFASEESAETVLDCIEKEETVPVVWKDVIGEGEKGVGLVNRIAMYGE